MKALKLLVEELKREVGLKTLYKVKSDAEVGKNKKLEESYGALRKRFDHLVIKNNEKKATLKVQNKELEQIDVLENNIEALKARIFRYEKDIGAHPDFKNYFKTLVALTPCVQ